MSREDERTHRGQFTGHIPPQQGNASSSATLGWGVGSQNAYPAQLQALLRGKGLHANVINAGVLGDTTAGMLRRLDTAVPKGTNIVILQPGGNDLRFGFSKEQRAANIGAMVTRLRARDIRVVVFDPEIPASFISGTTSILMRRLMPRSRPRSPAVAADAMAQPATLVAACPGRSHAARPQRSGRCGCPRFR